MFRPISLKKMTVWENHSDLLKIAQLLGVENEIISTAREQLPYLELVLIGKSGQIKEFREEEYYGDIGEYEHRHISHLVGLYPGTSITGDTPEYLKAAEYSLTERGDRSTGWATAHRFNAWARLKNGHFKGLVARGGFVFDAKWENGKLTEFKVYSKADNICRIRLTKQPLNSPDESSYSNGVLTFNAVAKRTYYFSFN